MTRREIPSEEWPSFMEQFTRLHHGKMAGVMTVDAKSGAEQSVRETPLLGVFDRRGGGGADEAIEIEFGGGMEQMVQVAHNHRVSRPSRVWTTEWNDGYSAELEIESADGGGITVRVGPAEQVLPPGMVTDGVLLE